MGTAKFTLDPSNLPELPPDTKARHDALTDEEITAAAVSDPDNPPLSDDELTCVALARRVRAIRERTGLSQEAFASRYRLTPGRLRDWEQGRSKPDPAMLIYLTLIDQNPEAVERALSAA